MWNNWDSSCVLSSLHKFKVARYSILPKPWIPKITNWEPFQVSIYFLPLEECKNKQTKIKQTNKQKRLLESRTLKRLPLISCPHCSSSQAISSRFQRSFIIAKEAEVLSVTWVNRLTTSQVTTRELCHFSICPTFRFLRNWSLFRGRGFRHVCVPSTGHAIPYSNLDVCQTYLFSIVSKTKTFCQRR